MLFIPVDSETYNKWASGEDVVLSAGRQGNFRERLGLTQAQEDVYRYIFDFQVANGVSPTFAEIGANFGWKSKNSAVDHVHRLERKGAIKIKDNCARSIVLCAGPCF